MGKSSHFYLTLPLTPSLVTSICLPVSVLHMEPCSTSLLSACPYLILTGCFRLYVGSLHFNLTESDIKQVFEPFGDLEFVDLHRDPMTGRSKGYAFVQYVSGLYTTRRTTSFLGTSELRMLEWLWNRWKALNLQVDR